MPQNCKNCKKRVFYNRKNCKKWAGIVKIVKSGLQLFQAMVGRLQLLQAMVGSGTVVVWFGNHRVIMEISGLIICENCRLEGVETSAAGGTASSAACPLTPMKTAGISLQH